MWDTYNSTTILRRNNDKNVHAVSGTAAEFLIISIIMRC